MTDEELAEIEACLEKSAARPVRMAIAELTLHCGKLAAEVRRLQSQATTVCQVRRGPWRCVNIRDHDGQHIWQLG